jgi:hypothetical protein
MKRICGHHWTKHDSRGGIRESVQSTTPSCEGESSMKCVRGNLMIQSSFFRRERTGINHSFWANRLQTRVQERRRKSFTYRFDVG